jgi:hypothetical protein
LSSTGARAITSLSISSRSGQRVAVVRLTPSTSSTERSSAYLLTLAAVCTATCARRRAGAQRLADVDHRAGPTLTTTLAPAVSAPRSSVPASARERAARPRA